MKKALLIGALELAVGIIGGLFILGNRYHYSFREHRFVDVSPAAPGVPVPRSE